VSNALDAAETFKVTQFDLAAGRSDRVFEGNGNPVVFRVETLFVPTIAVPLDAHVRIGPDREVTPYNSVPIHVGYNEQWATGTKVGQDWYATVTGLATARITVIEKRVQSGA
jgi:hypothetical protein